MDIRLKEGNLQEYHGSFSIGLLSSKFNIEGPIERNRSSFNITARRTYLDLLGAPIYAAINNTKDSKEKIGYLLFVNNINGERNDKKCLN